MPHEFGISWLVQERTDGGSLVHKDLDPQELVFKNHAAIPDIVDVLRQSRSEVPTSHVSTFSGAPFRPRKMTTTLAEYYITCHTETGRTRAYPMMVKELHRDDENDEAELVGRHGFDWCRLDGL
jgi:hypothetical protein